MRQNLLTFTRLHCHLATCASLYQLGWSGALESEDLTVRLRVDELCGDRESINDGIIFEPICKMSLQALSSPRLLEVDDCISGQNPMETLWMTGRIP